MSPRKDLDGVFADEQKTSFLADMMANMTVRTPAAKVKTPQDDLVSCCRLLHICSHCSNGSPFCTPIRCKDDHPPRGLTSVVHFFCRVVHVLTSHHNALALARLPPWQGAPRPARRRRQRALALAQGCLPGLLSVAQPSSHRTFRVRSTSQCLQCI